MLIRSVSSFKRWNGERPVHREDALFCGDAVTDLRTSDNTLSVWLANTEEDIEDAVVALTLSKDSPSKLFCLLLDEEDLAKIEIELSDTELGKALGADEAILKKHRNMVELDYWRLGYLTQYMMDLAKDATKRRTFSDKKVVEILNKYKGNKVKPENVNVKLREKLNW